MEKICGKGTLTLLDRQKLTLTCVDKIIEANDKFVFLSMDGCTLNIKGSGLQLEKLDIAQKTVEIIGLVDGIFYQKKRESVMTKLFSK